MRRSRLTEVLAGKTGGNDLGFGGKRAKFANVAAEVGLGEVGGQDGPRRGQDLAQEYGLVAGLGEARFQPADPSKEPNDLHVGPSCPESARSSPSLGQTRLAAQNKSRT